MTEAPSRRAVALKSTVATSRTALEGHEEAWDLLADACSRPFCAFDWLLGWWAHAAPPGARLAVVLVHDDDELVGVAPGFCDRGPAGVRRWRPLGAQTCQRVAPLAVDGREAEVAAEVARALHALRPRLQMVGFEGLEEGSPWPRLVAAAWPGNRRPRTVVTARATALVLDLDAEGFEPWFAAKGRHFRKRLRRARKLALEETGAAFRLADEASAAADLDTFLRLHVGRWEARGGSRAVPPPVAAFVRDAGPRLVAAGRLRVWSLDLHGRTIASSVVLVAGRQVGYWLSGFDTEHAELEPSKLGMLQVIEDAFGLGAARLDLGEGSYPYKQRFSEQGETLVTSWLVPPSWRVAQAAAALAPRRVRTWASARTSPERKAELRGLLERVRR